MVDTIVTTNMENPVLPTLQSHVETAKHPMVEAVVVTADPMLLKPRHR